MIIVFCYASVPVVSATPAAVCTSHPTFAGIWIFLEPLHLQPLPGVVHRVSSHLQSTSL